jgi:glycosyltransferase involved in cell wall biosynthesis
MQRQADAVVQHQVALPAHLAQRVTIGYLSGTPTHDRDFLQAADALLWALDTLPETRLVTVGPVELDPRFERFGERIQRLPLYPWQRLPEVLASIDINIAPLEPDNPFSEAKSCVKYMEAALVGVPTIASPCADFRRTVTPGVTGYLANSPADWREALACLISSADHRAQMGRQARADVLRQRTTKSAAVAFHTTLIDLIEQSSQAFARPVAGPALVSP